MIQFYLSLGLSTNDIFDIVFCRKPDDVASLCDGTDLSSCPKERDFYQEKLAEIEAQIASLEQAKAHIKQRLMRWHTEKHA